jgi:hypothetical protein
MKIQLAILFFICSILSFSQNDTTSYEKEISAALKDSDVNQYYKDIFDQGKLIRSDDLTMLSITDSLFTESLEKDFFYFVVFTKSMNDSDGFYGEALGLSALKFLKTKTEWFTDYFNVAPYLNDTDFENWVINIWGEISIAHENEEAKALNKLRVVCFENIKESRKEYQHVLKRLFDALNEKVKK